MLVLRHEGLARRMARRLARLGVPRDDLQQEALLALLRAARSWEAAEDVGFASYAIQRIRADFSKAYRSEPVVCLSSYDAARRSRLLTIQESSPGLSLGELARRAGIREEDASQLLAWSRKATSMHRSDAWRPGRAPEEILAAPVAEESVELSLEEIEARRAIRARTRHALCRLGDPRQRAILMLRMGLANGIEHPVKEVSALLGMSCRRVQRQERLAREAVAALLIDGGETPDELPPLPGFFQRIEPVQCPWPKCRNPSDLNGVCAIHENTINGSITRLGRPPRLAHRARIAAALWRFWPWAAEKLSADLLVLAPQEREPGRRCGVPECSASAVSRGLCARHADAAVELLAGAPVAPRRSVREVQALTASRWKLLSHALSGGPPAALPEPVRAYLHDRLQVLLRLAQEHQRPERILDAAYAAFAAARAPQRAPPAPEQALMQIQRDIKLLNALECRQGDAEASLELWLESVAPDWMALTRRKPVSSMVKTRLAGRHESA